MKQNIFVHSQYYKVYEGTVIKEIQGSIASAHFPVGTRVKVAIATTAFLLEGAIKEEIRQWRLSAGAQSVLCDDVEDQIDWQDVALKNPRNFHVWVLDEQKRLDVRFDFQSKEVKNHIQLTGKVLINESPEDIVQRSVSLHNARVW